MIHSSMKAICIYKSRKYTIVDDNKFIDSFAWLSHELSLMELSIFGRIYRITEL